MRFDIVIGNPPYNNDLYIDFANTLNNLANRYQILITPSKWIAKSSDNNDEFRRNIVPHISNIVYYIDARELFDIGEPDGISYYLIEKDIFNNKTIVNICKKQPLFNSTQYRELEYHINNTLNTIIKKIIHTDKIRVSTDRTYFIKPNTELNSDKRENSIVVIGGDSDGEKMVYGYLTRNDSIKHPEDIDRYKVVVNFKFGNGRFTLGTNGKTLGISNLKIYNPGEICKDCYLVLHTSDSLEEAESFKSYFETKLVKLLIFAGCISANASNAETWRFVPDQVNYNHIFTDNELYKIYGYNSEEIGVIESIIK